MNTNRLSGGDALDGMSQLKHVVNAGWRTWCRHWTKQDDNLLLQWWPDGMDFPSSPLHIIKGLDLRKGRTSLADHLICVKGVLGSILYDAPWCLQEILDQACPLLPDRLEMAMWPSLLPRGNSALQLPSPSPVTDWPDAISWYSLLPLTNSGWSCDFPLVYDSWLHYNGIILQTQMHATQICPINVHCYWWGRQGWSFWWLKTSAWMLIRIYITTWKSARLCHF